MPFTAPSNESLLTDTIVDGKPQHHIRDSGKQRYLSIRKAAETYFAKNPQATSALVESYMHDLLEHENQLVVVNEAKFQAENKLREQSNRPKLPEMALEQELNIKRREFDNKFGAERVDKSDPVAMAAWNGVGHTLEGPSIIDGVVKQVYDSDKGGIQPGGIIGLLIGMLAGYKLMGAAGSGWFGIAVGVFAALAGAWVGNQAGNMIGSAMKKPDATPTQSPLVTPVKAPVQQPAAAPTDLHPDAQKAALDAGQTAGVKLTDVNDEHGNKSHNAPVASKPHPAGHRAPADGKINPLTGRLNPPAPSTNPR